MPWHDRFSDSLLLQKAEGFILTKFLVTLEVLKATTTHPPINPSPLHQFFCQG